MNKIFNKLTNILTKNKTEIPLFYVNFDYIKYKDNKIGSCMYNVHPIFKEDKYVKEKLNDLIDYIRNKYDMENI